MSDNNLLLEVQGLRKTFKARGRQVQALRGIDLNIYKGETVGVVGESGSGKSTLGRCTLGLLKYEQGKVRFDGSEIQSLRPRELREKRRDMQLIFQDPSAAMNPNMTIARNIEDPLIVHGMGSKAERLRKVAQFMDRVGLHATYGAALPYELSGGQQQRAMIARALILGPKFVVCDEAVSALDVSVQAQILALLQEIQTDEGLTYLFISHNLSAVGYLSHHIAVMYLGQIVEISPTDELLAHPRHPYTINLLNSILQTPPSKNERSSLEALPGEIPSPSNVPTGCAFHTRCPIAQAVCREKAPLVHQVGDRHQVACHFADEM